MQDQLSIELGMDHRPSSSWSAIAAGLIGCTTGILIATAILPANSFYTAPSQTLQRAIPIATAGNFRSSSYLAADRTSTVLQQEQLMRVASASSTNSSFNTPLAAAASGLVLLLAAAFKFVRTTGPQPSGYAMLATTAGRSERERRQQEKEAAKQREIQERLQRLARSGLLPKDHPISAPSAAAAPSSAAAAGAPLGTPNEWERRQQERARAEREREAAKQREIQERLARLANMGFSVSKSASPQGKAPPANLTLHVYDHCPYCIRVELFLGWNGVKYNRVVYGYGDMEGPKVLIGKKQLPILTGDGAPYPAGMRGMPESLDMINWLSKDFGLTIQPASGRKDYSDWQKKAKNVIAGLMRPRLLKMPFRDFQTKADVDYATAKWAKKGYSVEQSWANTPQLLAEMERLLLELEPMVLGEASLNKGGLSMDDIFLLPDLRRLTVVRDLRWPRKLRSYVDKALDYPAMQCVPYTKWAF